MAEAIGHNTVSAEKLRNYIDRLERIAEQKKQLSEEEKAIKAEAAAEGFNVKQGINYVLKIRKMKPQDRQDAEDTRDIYLHAMGMLPEPPLFRALATAVKDPASQEQVLEALKNLAPANGDIVMRMGAKSVRIWRDKDGKAHAEDYTPAPPPSAASETIAAGRPKKEVPDCTAHEAEQMGEQAAKDNEPVIANPFPYGDHRRAKWDQGWRRGSGNDGMGG
jgi:uncharacterized protein (UPF0335 family)